MNALVAGTFGKIQRTKGVLPCGGQNLRFDVVGTQWQVSGADPDSDTTPASSVDSVAIFIGNDLHKSWLREVLVPEVRAALERGQATAAQSEAFEIQHAHVHDHKHYVENLFSNLVRHMEGIASLRLAKNSIQFVGWTRARVLGYAGAIFCGLLPHFGITFAVNYKM